MSEPVREVTDALREAADDVRRRGVHEVEDGATTEPPRPRAVEPRWFAAPSVWAPRASQVELELADRRVPMRRDDPDERRAWWSTSEPLDLRAGTDYRFVLDGDPLPDPRSPWQPAGVHGPSRTVDHGAFEWTDAGWRAPELSGAVFYELHVGTFTTEGTFEAAIGRLDDLVRLGVSHVELMPVAEFPGDRGWGYDGVDLFAPRHAYGGPEGLKRLVDALHAHGLAAVLDVVYNHVGPDGNYLPRFGPYLTDRHHVSWGDAVNFDGPGSDEVRAFVLDNAAAWLRDYHFDALRLDAVHAIFDASAVHILEALEERIEALSSELGRPLALVAESDLNDPRLVRPREAGGYGLAAQWSDDFHHALHTTLTGESQGYYADFEGIRHLAAALEGAWVYTGQYSTARERRHGRPPAAIPATRFVGYLQNHDQIGNRALGERSSQLLPPDALRVAAAIVLTAPFVPLLFEGEEWGAGTPFLYFTNHRDPDLAKAVREGRREAFGAFGWPADRVPDPGDPATFERSKLDWSERDREPHASLLAWHRELIGLRRELPWMHDGAYPRVRFDAAEGWLVVERPAAVLACNLAPVARAVPLPEIDDPSIRLSSKQATLAGDGARVSLPPMAAALIVPGGGTGPEPGG